MDAATTPLVSVGIATYNRPDSLKKALDCVINQTYKNLEILISEDCSPCEETKKLLREYAQKDSRIRLFSQKKNLGPPANIHFVLEQATGEYFMWADDDDVRDERWVEVLLKKLSAEDAVVAIGNVASMDMNGMPVKQYGSLQFSGPRTLRLASYYLAVESEGKANIVCGLFRTNFVRNIKYWGQYNRKYFGVDYLFVLDCIQRGNVLVDSSVSIYKRLPVGKSQPISGPRDYLQRLYRRLQYFIVCICITRNWFDKTVLLLLLPIKLLKSFYCRMVAHAK